MPYHAFIPAPPLRPYIDLYWLLTGVWTRPEPITLTPDGGVTLVLNLGEEVRSEHFPLVQHEGVYLVGTMLHGDVQTLLGDVRLFGIQFRPGAFPLFYRYEPMDRLVNQVLEFERNLFPDVGKIMRDFVPCVDRFYLERLSPPRDSLLAVVADVERLDGQVKTEALARRHCTTERQLERRFREQLGISPKAFINLTRFRQAFGKIQQNPSGQSLMDLAWECGYYDHAHLTNDFKRYMGSAPTALILSDFSKTVALKPD
jgi:AraC-like DNA-binding protein